MLALAACAACGDNNGSGDDDGDDDAPTIDAAVPIDGPPPDAVDCPARGVGEVGGACDDHADCDSANGSADGFCYETGTLGTEILPPEGYCTLDDGSGTFCDTDADCGAGNVCATDTVNNYKFCIPDCTCPQDVCPPNQACFDSFFGIALDKQGCVPGNADAVDGDPCAGFYECNDYSGCTNDFEFPGGVCARFGCTVGDDTTCHGGHCIDVTGETPLSGTLCVDTCSNDNDCRTAEGYVCFDPGAEPSYCRHPHAGDACDNAADCGGGLWQCYGVTDGFVGGYCAQEGCPFGGTSMGCSSGTACANPSTGANYCADRCDASDVGTQGRCRTGYMCQDADGGTGVVGVCAPPGTIT
jgi:hypothetical protein